MIAQQERERQQRQAEQARRDAERQRQQQAQQRSSPSSGSSSAVASAPAAGARPTSTRSAPQYEETRREARWTARSSPGSFGDNGYGSEQEARAALERKIESGSRLNCPKHKDATAPVVGSVSCSSRKNGADLQKIAQAPPESHFCQAEVSCTVTDRKRIGPAYDPNTSGASSQ